MLERFLLHPCGGVVSRDLRLAGIVPARSRSEGPRDERVRALAIVGLETFEDDALNEMMRKRERKTGRTYPNETEFDRLRQCVDELIVAPARRRRQHVQVETQHTTIAA